MVVFEKDKQVFSPKEAAEWLGFVSLGVPNPEASMRHLHKQRKLRGVKIGGRLAFLRPDLEAYTEKLRTEAIRREAHNGN